MKKNPKDFLKFTLAMNKNLRAASKKEIAVGLPKSSLSTRKIYKSGKKTVLDIGLIHEFGLGKNPVRSFLRVPFSKEKNKVDKSLAISFKKISEGAEVIKQMERNAIFLRNIAAKAFTNKGYGTWDELSEQTKEQKGNDTILTETGTLKQSITYVVRNATA